MEVALARLVGAGLTLVFEGYGHKVPTGAVENGLELIRYIARKRPGVALDLTQGVITAIWNEWRASKLPDTLALAHVEALPKVMDRHRGGDETMRDSIAAMQAGAQAQGSPNVRQLNPSTRVAAAILTDAQKSGMLERLGLNQSVAFFFLDRLLSHLIPDQELFAELGPLLAHYIDAKGWLPDAGQEIAPAVREDQPVAGGHTEPAKTEPEPALAVSAPLPDEASGEPSRVSAAPLPHAEVESQPEPAPPLPAQGEPLASLADSLSESIYGSPQILPEPVLATPAAAEPEESTAAAEPAADPVDQAAASHGVPVATLRYFAERAATRLGQLGEGGPDDLAFGLRDILHRLQQPACASAAAADFCREAARSLETCDADTADMLLGQAEDVDLKAAPSDLPNAHRHLTDAAATRCLRALIEELSGDFRRAARHYAQSARCLPSTDRASRRIYLLRQAGALVAQGEIAGETAALAEAAQVYAEAGRLISEQDAPLEWAATHLELGRVLMQLGEREGRTERFLAAALHFKPASDVFSHHKQHGSWARAQLGLADALRSQGEVQGDVLTLSEAAFSYRAALGFATRDRMAAEWAIASYRLGSTLLRIDTETGGSEHLEEAAMALRVMHSDDVVSPLVRCQAKAKLARTLVVLARIRNESWHEDEALTLIRACLDEARALKPEARAALDDELGGLLAAIGEARESADLVTEASELKLAALDRLQASDKPESAERIREELTVIQAAMARLAPPLPETAAA